MRRLLHPDKRLELFFALGVMSLIAVLVLGEQAAAVCGWLAIAAISAGLLTGSGDRGHR